MLRPRVEVVAGDLLDPLPRSLRGQVDLVVSNPPYVEAEEFATLPREVRADPGSALVGGVEVYERLFAQACEVARGPAARSRSRSARRRLLRSETSPPRPGSCDVEVHADLTGRDRVVTARTPA